MNINKPAFNTMSLGDMVEVNRPAHERRKKRKPKGIGLQGRKCAACRKGHHSVCYSKTCGCETCKIGLEE